MKQHIAFVNINKILFLLFLPRRKSSPLRSTKEISINIFLLYPKPDNNRSTLSHNKKCKAYLQNMLAASTSRVEDNKYLDDHY